MTIIVQELKDDNSNRKSEIQRCENYKKMLMIQLN